MRAAIMQPYFFPYIGYWQLFFNCDVWVFFDCVQYNKKSWMNRNRILHSDSNKEFQYINVPIRKHGRGTLIRDVMINQNEEWEKKILGQLTLYKRLRAPYYEAVTDLVSDVMAHNDDYFMSLIIRMAEKLCDYLEIKVDYRIASGMGVDDGLIHKADDWALVISRMLGADSYINPYGGAEIFDVDKYYRNGIEIRFLRPELREYRQSRRAFIPGLSIIDVLMFNSVESVRDMLRNDYELLEKAAVVN